LESDTTKMESENAPQLFFFMNLEWDTTKVEPDKCTKAFEVGIRSK